MTFIPWIGLVIALGLLAWFATKAISARKEASEESDRAEKLESELDETARQLDIERKAVARFQSVADGLRLDLDAAREELKRLAPGDVRLKSTLEGGV